MTPEAQQIAIAKVCPNIQLIGDYWHWSPDGRRWFGCVLNDPLSDLNAMHEAEKIFTEDQQRHYAHYELPLKIGIMGLSSPENFTLLHATATQRAEALLRTLNLRTEN